MIQKARFINIKGQIQLCMVTYNDGMMVDINGPVSCMGDVGVSRDQFIQSMDNLLVEAKHGSPVLELSDLPKSLVDEIEAALTQKELDALDEAVNGVDLPEETVRDLEEAINEIDLKEEVNQ